MKIRYRWSILGLLVLLLAMPLLAACSNDETAATSTGNSIGTPTEASSAAEPVARLKITLGSLTDLTGLASQAFATVNAALEDMIRYYNEENLIPGVELEVLHYDGQYKPSRDIPGYEWLKERGVSLFVTGIPSTSVTLKSRADEEQRLIFSMSAFPDIEDPPGYVFAMNNDTINFGPTLLKWIAENDWDYQTNGPAKVGAAGWPGNYWETLWNGAEAYCAEHPEQFEWQGALLNSNSYDWSAEVYELRNVDYVLPPGAAIATFTRAYKQADGKGKLVMTDAHVPFLGLTVETTGADFMDGWLLIMPSRWWDEDYDVPNLAKELLARYHSESEAEGIVATGGAYLTTVNQFYGMMQLLANHLNDVGPENFSQQTLYDAATAFSVEFAGGQEFGFSDVKRTAWSNIGMYEFDGDTQSLVRADPEWLPLVSN